MKHRIKKQNQKYLLWRVKNLYLNDVIRVEEYVKVPSQDKSTLTYIARVIEVTAFAGEWRVLLRNGKQVHSFIIDQEGQDCFIKRIDIIQENCNGDC